ncbi:MAG: integrase [Pseudolabrys sp.]|nr:integrase [Pseudolabrys sp.]
MTTMNSEVYDALLSAGADETKARKAAESVAAFDGRFSKIESDLGLVKWMLGFNLALTIGVLARLFLRS